MWSVKLSVTSFSTDIKLSLKHSSSIEILFIPWLNYTFINWNFIYHPLIFAILFIRWFHLYRITWHRLFTINHPLHVELMDHWIYLLTRSTFYSFITNLTWTCYKILINWQVFNQQILKVSCYLLIVTILKQVHKLLRVLLSLKSSVT